MAVELSSFMMEMPDCVEYTPFHYSCKPQKIETNKSGFETLFHCVIMFLYQVFGIQPQSESDETLNSNADNDQISTQITENESEDEHDEEGKDEEDENENESEDEGLIKAIGEMIEAVDRAAEALDGISMIEIFDTQSTEPESEEVIELEAKSEEEPEGELKNIYDEEREAFMTLTGHIKAALYVLQESEMIQPAPSGFVLWD